MTGQQAMDSLLTRLRARPGARVISLGGARSLFILANQNVKAPSRHDSYVTYEEAVVIRAGGADWTFVVGKHGGAAPADWRPLTSLVLCTLHVDADTPDEVLAAYACEWAIGMAARTFATRLFITSDNGSLILYKPHPKAARLKEILREIDGEALFHEQPVLSQSVLYTSRIVDALEQALLRLMDEGA